MSVATEHFAYPLSVAPEISPVQPTRLATILITGGILAAFVWVGATALLFGMMVGWL
jgi:hypothetical protein